MTSEEYAELNDLRRWKAEADRKVEERKALAARIAAVTDDLRQLIRERKQSRLPDGGVR